MYKITLYMITFCVLFMNSVHSSQFSNTYNHYSGKPIKKLKIFGERCSGTNYIESLLHANFPTLEKTDPLEFGHKHFLWWLGTPANTEKLRKLKFTRDAISFKGSQDYLFVVIVRDPYDWLRSFYLMPHCVHGDLLGKNFFHFVTSTWKLVQTYPEHEGDYNEIDNYNPWTGKPFSNVLELRAYKNANYLTLGTIVNNFLLVRYEDICKDPENFICYVAKAYHLEKSKEYHPINTYKGLDTPYTQKQYFPLTPLDLEFINNSLDWDIEKKIGYFPKKSI